MSRFAIDDLTLKCDAPHHSFPANCGVRYIAMEYEYDRGQERPMVDGEIESGRYS